MENPTDEEKTIPGENIQRMKKKIKSGLANISFYTTAPQPFLLLVKPPWHDHKK